MFGLPPGEYYVSASASGLGELIGRGLQQLAAGIGALGGRRRRTRRCAARPLGRSDEAGADRLRADLLPGRRQRARSRQGRRSRPGQEVGGIDFQIQLVPFATVSGIVAGAEEVVAGHADAAGQSAGGRGPLGGPMLTGRTQADGTFSISQRAARPLRRDRAIGRTRRRAAHRRCRPIVVNGQNIGGVSLTLQPGVTLSGNITVESSGTPAPTDYSAFRVDAPDVTPLPFGGGGGRRRRRGALAAGGGRAEKNGSFPDRQPAARQALHPRAAAAGVQGAAARRSGR